MIWNTNLQERYVMNKFNKLLVAVGLFALAGNAAATLISGDISLKGNFTLNGSDFLTSSIINVSSATVAGTPTGSFASISSGTTASYSSINYSNTTGVSALWSVGGFTFDLTNLVVQSITSSKIKLTGSGIISGNGFTSTFSNWSFNANTNGNLVFSNSTSVPAPGIALLMGIGLAGIGLAGKMRKYT